MLTIRTTGVEDYIDGSANIKMLVIGGPGVGKTRSSSFWPKPIYGDCESGRGSIADRKMPYAEIKSSQDMLDFLAYLKSLERIPKRDRQFQTVVIDTLDGFQRKVKDEWLLQTKSSSFKGYDAWGYLDSKMSALMTRLLNLDYNVIVLVHYKDKTIKDGDLETHELMLQLQGDIKDTAFNDFDLVGWMGSYWDAGDDGRVEKRGLSFEKTPQRPFVKDRFGVMPKWIPITFTDEDYSQIFEAFLSRVDNLPEVEELGEIPSSQASDMSPHVVPASAPQGALPPIDPKDIPLTQFDKPTLITMCRQEGCATTVDGQPIKGNTIKGELVAALTAHRAKVAAEADAKSASVPVEPTETPAPNSDADVASPPAAPVDVLPIDQVAADAAATPVLAAGVDAEPVDAQADAVALVIGTAGGEVVSETTNAETPPSPPAAPEQTCAIASCDEILSQQERPDIKAISFVKFRKHYCNAHFHKAKELGRPLREDEA